MYIYIGFTVVPDMLASMDEISLAQISTGHKPALIDVINYEACRLALKWDRPRTQYHESGRVNVLGQ